MNNSQKRSIPFITIEEMNELREYFDENLYAYTKEAKESGIDSLDHYLKIGEDLDAAPSARFDPKHYRSISPDLALSGLSLLHHFIRHGRAEGRQPVAPASAASLSIDRIDPRKETILLLVHDASRTGAPILGWNIARELSARYNVVTILLSGGPLEDAFETVSTEVIRQALPNGSSPQAAQTLGDNLVEFYKPIFAIANSVATRDLAVALETANLPVVALIHEFAADFSPRGVLNPLFARVSKLVFPAEIVFSECKSLYDYLRGRDHTILRQGSCALPQVVGHATNSRSLPVDDVFTVVGMGTITYRKGVDAFLATAASLKRDLGRDDFRFVWVGDNIPIDWRYRLYMDEQVAKSGLSDNVVFLGEVADLEEAYGRADVFFLSSRLDPLPNVAIDAALKGLPIVCFDQASGISEILATYPQTRDLVVPYLDASTAALQVRTLMDDRSRLKTISGFMRREASALFDMAAYVARIEGLGRDAIRERSRLPGDVRTIRESGVFNADLCFGERAQTFAGETGIVEYLNCSRLARPLSQVDAGLFIRRPMPGFNPLIYALAHPELETTHEDPFADFIDRGRPKGPWLHPVIGPHSPSTASGLRIALHGHFFYSDLIQDFIDHLAPNASVADLFITTSTREQEEGIRAILAAAGIPNADVWTVPNRGRDIGPFLVDMPAKLAGYDMVGHIHGKRSKHVDSTVGDSWREFAWQHLIGGANPMMDHVAAAFDAHPEIGLIFPEDPHLNGWDKNSELARGLAQRMGISPDLPTHFDFPIGTMLWARPAALQPLFDLGLTWDDFPSEPLPIDGTLLHTLERLVPFAARKAGYAYATTHVREFVR